MAKNNVKVADQKSDKKQDNKHEDKSPKNDNKVCQPSKDDCRDDKKDDHKDDHKNDKGKGHKPSIWNCDDGFYGAPHHGPKDHGPKDHGHGCGNNNGCTTTDVAKTFTGNFFPTNLSEGKHIDAAAQAALGEIRSNMDISENATIKGQITYEEAGYDNTLGVFTIKCDGTIQAVEMAVANTENVGATFQIEAGQGAEQLGFFLVPDGWTRFGGYDAFDIDAGSLKFVTNYGLPNESLTKVTDDGNKVTLIFTNAEGEATVVPGPFWFTTDRGGSNSLNIDGDVHTISGIDGTDASTLKIGFEDWPSSKSDYDYNDTVFTVKITEEVNSCGPKDCSPPPCAPQPPVCEPKPHCDVRDIIDFGDSVTNVVSNYISTVTTNIVSHTNTTTNYISAAAVLTTVSTDDLVVHNAQNAA